MAPTLPDAPVSTSLDLFEALRTRRSVRRFKKDRVAAADVEAILDAALCAPTACNAQLWRFVVLDADALRRQLTGCATPVLDLDPPLSIAVLYDRRFTREHAAYAQSAAAATQNMLLAATARGLAGLWMCHYGDEAVIRRRLGIPPEYEITAFVLLGHPDESHPAPARRPFHEVVSHGRFGWSGEEAFFPKSWRPRDWTHRQLREWVNYGARAKSPLRTARPSRDVQALLRDVPPAAGRTLYFGADVDGGLHELARTGRVGGPLRAVVLAPEVAVVVRESAAAADLPREVEYEVYDGEALQAPDGSFDTVLCLHQLERLPDPGRLAGELRRVLRPGGRLVLLAANLLSPYYLGWSAWRRLRAPNGPLRGPFEPLAPWRLRALLRGLAVRDRRGVMLGQGALGAFTTAGPARVLCRSWLWILEKPA